MNRICKYFKKVLWLIKSRKCKKRSIKSFCDTGLRMVAPECITINYGFNAGKNLKLQAWKKYRGCSYDPSIIIGEEVSIMDNCQISCMNEVIIGQGTLLGDNVMIVDNNHGHPNNETSLPPLKRELTSKGPVHIGKNVWIGRNSCILSGVTIGDGAVVGANSVVTHDVDAMTTVAGVPARAIKTRN